LDEFKSQTSQTSSHFFPISSNTCVLGITEQALIGIFFFQLLDWFLDFIGWGLGANVKCDCDLLENYVGILTKSLLADIVSIVMV
jgi:hypothetical protein